MQLKSLYISEEFMLKLLVGLAGKVAIFQIQKSHVYYSIYYVSCVVQLSSETWNFYVYMDKGR